MKARNRSKKIFYCEECKEVHKVEYWERNGKIIPIMDPGPIKVDEKAVEDMKKALKESLKDAKEKGKGRKVH
jgi:hypothetical protein